jgi:hypothetical protein
MLVNSLEKSVLFGYAHLDDRRVETSPVVEESRKRVEDVIRVIWDNLEVISAP